MDKHTTMPTPNHGNRDITAALAAVAILCAACSTDGAGNVIAGSSSQSQIRISFADDQAFSLRAAQSSQFLTLGQVEHTLEAGSQAPVYALSGAGASQFRIDSQANLYLDAQADSIKAPLSLRVEALDKPGASAAIAFTTITILDEAPPVAVIGSGQSFRLATGDPSSTVALGQLDYSARNLLSPLVFVLDGEDAENFRVNSSGLIYLREPIQEDSRAITLTISAHQGAVAAAALARSSITIQLDASTAASRVDFSARPVADGGDGLRIAFAPIVPDSIAPSSWRWDFGDGSAVATERAPTHSYQRAGSYAVTLRLDRNNGTDIVVAHRVYPYENDDPLRDLQWYLDNDPISPFIADNSLFGSMLSHTINGSAIAVAGEDINAIDHLSACGVLDSCRGEGIVVQVVDRAAQLDHPDLRENTRAGKSLNLFEPARDPVDAYSQYQLTSPVAATGQRHFLSLVSQNRSLAHGTAVSGIILARDFNGVGIRGIAPRAELASYNFLDNQSDRSRLRTLAARGIDVSNNSWSVSAAPGELPIEHLRLPSSSVDALEEMMADERGGLGRLVFKSSGNAGEESAAGRSLFGNRHNAGAEAFQNLRYVMSIGSINANGRANDSSEGGANLLAVAYDNPPCGTGFFANPIAIVTTDLVGNLGVAYSTPGHLLGGVLDSPKIWEAPDDILDYSYCFGGTSASAPMVSGAGALLLQARPDLSWRDARAILASSCRTNHSDDAGWATNGAEFATHYIYGFGALDIEAALALAKTWQRLPPEIAYDSGAIRTAAAIPDCSNRCASTPPTAASGSSYTTVLTPQTSIRRIESVLVDLRLSFDSLDRSQAKSQALRGTISISLEHIGPDGRLLSSSLLHKYHPYYASYLSSVDLEDRDETTAFLDWTFLSLRHFGESPVGTWRLRITDYVEDDSTIELERWSLRLHGY